MYKTTTNIFFDSKAINRSIIRLSHEILEKNEKADNLILVGILSRGEPLALRLQSNIKHTVLPFQECANDVLLCVY